MSFCIYLFVVVVVVVVVVVFLTTFTAKHEPPRRGSKMLGSKVFLPSFFLSAFLHGEYKFSFLFQILRCAQLSLALLLKTMSHFS